MTSAIAAVLGKCRAQARALKQGGLHRAAGNEAKAQHLEHRAHSGGPITAKDRAAKAQALLAQRAHRATASERGNALAKRTEAAHEAMRGKEGYGRALDRSIKVKRITDRLERYRKGAAASPPDAKAQRMLDRSRGRDLMAHRMSSGEPGYYSKLREKRLAGEASKPAATAKPSLRDQAAAVRAGKGNTTDRAKALAEKARGYQKKHLERAGRVTLNEDGNPTIANRKQPEFMRKAAQAKLDNAWQHHERLSQHERKLRGMAPTKLEAHKALGGPTQPAARTTPKAMPAATRTIKLKATTAEHKAAARAVADVIDERHILNKAIANGIPPGAREVMGQQVARKYATAQEALKTARKAEPAKAATPALVRPSLHEQAAAHRAAKGSDVWRARDLLGRHKTAFNKARDQAKRAMASGKTDVAAARTERVNTLSNRMESLVARMGIQSPKNPVGSAGNPIDVTPAAAVPVKAVATPGNASAAHTGKFVAAKTAKAESGVTTSQIKAGLTKLHGGEIDDRGNSVEGFAKRLGVAPHELAPALDKLAAKGAIEYDYGDHVWASAAKGSGGFVHTHEGKPVAAFRVMRANRLEGETAPASSPAHASPTTPSHIATAPKATAPKATKAITHQEALGQLHQLREFAHVTHPNAILGDVKEIAEGLSHSDLRHVQRQFLGVKTPLGSTKAQMSAHILSHIMKAADRKEHAAGIR